MAVATATVTPYAYPNGYDQTRSRSTVTGTISISTGGTYPPGGFTVNWAGFEGVKAIPPAGHTTPFPVDVNVKSVQNPPSGYIYLWDNVLGNIHIFETDNGAAGSNASGPLLEIGGGISNSIVTDIIQFTAEYIRE